MNQTKILFLAANPQDTGRLALDEEVRAIQKRLQGGEAGSRFVFCAEWALRADELPAVVMRHKPDIVHFSSHGSQSGELILSSTEGQATPVAAATLARLFALLGGVRCVVLNACYSQSQAAAIAATVPAVIGMSRALPDKAALSFAAGFYEALSFGKSIQAAFELARVQIELAELGDQREIPHLILRPGAEMEPLFVGTPLRPAPTTRWAASWRHSRWRIPAGIVMAGIALAALLFALRRQRAVEIRPTQAPSAYSGKPASPRPTEAPPAPAPASGSGSDLIGSGNEIRAQEGSRVRAGVIGSTMPALTPTRASGTSMQIGSGNRIEAGPGATVETGIIVNPVSSPSSKESMPRRR